MNPVGIPLMVGSVYRYPLGRLKLNRSYLIINIISLFSYLSFCPTHQFIHQSIHKFLLRLHMVPVQVRTCMIEGEPWFVAKDVCDVLGLASVAGFIRKVPDAQKGLYRMQTPGGNQQLSIVSEAGLYRLVMRSDKPEAEPFIAWVTEEVIPTIRKTGGAYMTVSKAEELLANPDFIIGLAKQVIQLKATRERLDYDHDG